MKGIGDTFTLFATRSNHAKRGRVLASVGLALLSSPAVGDEKSIPPPRKADSDAPLAEGWPDATKPGAIAVKKYPAYRGAVTRAKGAVLGADNVMFWPLFNHISRSKVEMTAPVVNTYSPQMLGDDRNATGDVSMEFVYRDTTIGQPGAGVGPVKVEDHPASTFVCLGIQGGMSSDRLREGVARLRSWLKEHANEWVEDGPPCGSATTGR